VSAAKGATVSGDHGETASVANGATVSGDQGDIVAAAKGATVSEDQGDIVSAAKDATMSGDQGGTASAANGATMSGDGATEPGGKGETQDQSNDDAAASDSSGDEYVSPMYCSHVLTLFLLAVGCIVV
jgi:hypothetical protein